MEKETAYIVLILVAGLVITMLFGCGADINPIAGNGQCQGVQTDEGVTIYCPGQSNLYVSNGVAGSPGPTGGVGQEGPTGPQGTPGTQITIVQLCPATFVPTYPTTFPEVALCISNQLYGVYSANDGFLSLLPPGTYVSNGIGASCTVTVGANCEVIH